MLARSTKLHHPLGITMETPLLVPSFSSKGFGFNKAGKSEIKDIFDFASGYLTDTMLISAYDLAYDNLNPIESSITEIIIVDSGGYEVSDFHDLSVVYRQSVQPNKWSLDQLQNTYDAWPNYIPAVFVSYDHPGQHLSLQDQIEAARSLFARYPRQLNTLLIKPETKDQQYVKISNVIANVDALRDFNIIGLTEKELGSSILKRMTNIAAIRFAMDDAGNKTPIHVYGSLDPITSVLYFLAGAEIFDGLTWLRFGYTDGLACYQYNYGAKKISVVKDDNFIKAKTIQENLSYLSELSIQMHKFLLDDHDFNMFKENAGLLRDSYYLLRTKNMRIT
jgi:hypothetical protein